MKRIFIFLMVCIVSFAETNDNYQVIVSQLDFGLKNSNNYKLSGLTVNGKIKAISNNTSSLGDSINYDFTYGNDFIVQSQPGVFGYNGQEEKAVIIPVDRNTESTVKNGVFELRENLKNTKTGEDVTVISLRENYKLPAKVIELKESIIDSGNRFIYNEPSDIIAKHMETYKIQDFMIRISKQGANSDYDIINKINKIRQAENVERGYSGDNAEMFYKGLSSYVDFWVTGDRYDKEKKIETNSGMGLRFLPGKIDIYGLPKGNYKIELYSFRYSKDVIDKGNLVITKESSLNFQANSYVPEESINLLSFYTGNYPNMEATILTIGKTNDSTLNINEFSNGNKKIPLNIKKTRIPIDKIYLDGENPIILDSNGYDIKSKLYYQKWNIVYTTQFMERDNNVRKVSFLLSSINKEVTAEYNIKVDFPIVIGYPHQTVMAIFNPLRNWEIGEFDIIDRTMNRYTRGYKNIKLTQSESIEKLYLGNFVDRIEMGINGNSYYWDNYNSLSSNSVIIKKVLSESKGTLAKINGNDIFTYYTTLGIKNFNYSEEKLTEKIDRATFSWESPSKASFGVTLNEDKVIFRIVKLNDGESETISENYTIDGHTYRENLPKRYYKHYEKENIIGSEDVNESVNDFVEGKRDYCDLVFDSGSDKEIVAANVVFTFSKENSLQVVGLPRGSYIIQIYSLQDEDSYAKIRDSYSYRVLTYSGYKKFEMGLPSLVTGNFFTQNNIFLIDSINLTNGFDKFTNAPEKIIQVGFYTKSQTELSLKSDNLIARRDEAIDKKERPFGVTEQKNYIGSILPATNISIEKSKKEDFKFPLDIVLVIDNSASMQPAITSVKNGLVDFANELSVRGFDVKYNLVTFGGPQYSATKGDTQVYSYEDYVYNDWEKTNYPYFAQFKGNGEWFSKAEEVVVALGKLKTQTGYPHGQENGAWAIKKSMDYLKTYGRYLNKENKVVNYNGENFASSQKWIIFLTDENLNMSGQRVLYGANNDHDFKERFLEDIQQTVNQHKIVFTGIFHINKTSPYIVEKDDLGNTGLYPAEARQMNYNDIKEKIGTDLFKTYEMGSTGQLVSRALSHAVNNVGVIQRWEMKYLSPFVENDGLKREVIFSLKDVKVNQYDSIKRAIVQKELEIKPVIRGEERFYIVPQEKLEANFINPDSVIKKIVKKDEKVILKAIARSEYREENGMVYNYPIKKGTFIISTMDGIKTMILSSEQTQGEKVYLSDFVNSYGQKWYDATLTIDSDSFEAKFGKNPLLKIQFIVETEEESKKIEISGVEYSENVPPKITRISYKNDTLENLMDSLTFEKNDKIFNKIEIGDMSTITLISNSNIGLESKDFGKIVNKKRMILNAKKNDQIAIEFDIDDESISKESKNVKIKYDTQDLDVQYIGTTDNSGSRITKWRANLDYKSGINNLSFYIQDDSNLKNTTIIEGEAFTEPPLINNTTIKKNEFKDADPSGMYHKGDILSSLDKTEEILAYFMVFKYSFDFSDEGATKLNYESDGPISWAASKNGKFPFSDGRYLYYGKVFVINKAGAISDITNVKENSLMDSTPKINSLSAITSKIVKDYKQEFFSVDRIPPKSSQFEFSKMIDANFSGVLYRDKEANKILTGKNKPYKSGDTISISATIKEKNFQKISFDGGDIGNIFTDSDWGEPKDGKYIKVGEGKDYNEVNISGVFNGSIGIDVYDKAGNIAQQVHNTSEKLRVLITYDDRIPGKVITTSKITGNGLKYTNDETLPLESISKNVPISLIETSNGYIGSFKDIKSLNNGINEYPIIKNINNIFNLKSYSQSGMAGQDYFYESIILDTEINDKRTRFINNINSNIKNNETSLSNFFSIISELVGIQGFALKGPKDISDVILEHNGIKMIANSEGIYNVSGALYRPNIGVSDFINEEYTLSFKTSKKGDIVFLLDVFDRLGNMKTFNYIVSIPSNISIIGKTINSEKKIISNVIMANKPKIESRIER